MKRTVRPIKILAYGDSPIVPSGFGTVMRNVFYHLGKSGDYHIDIYGINDRGAWKDPQTHPYHVYQAMPPGEQDPYGRSSFVNTIRGGGIDLEPPWDIIFFLNDPFVLENPIPYFDLGTIPATKDIQKTHYTQLPPETWFKTVGYFPVDSMVKPHWLYGAIRLTDVAVAYNDYGHQEITKANLLQDKPFDIDLKIIPHGNNFDEYYPLEKEVINNFKQNYFANQIREETFIVTVVGRNQRRKDIPRSMKIFKEFQKRRPDSFLYVHAEETERWGSLREVGHQLGLKQGKDWNYPKDFIATKGYPHQVMNGIYNASDVLLSTTQGEGWGLPITEAMAAKTVVLAPNITSIPELFNTVGMENQDIINPTKLSRSTIRGIPLQSGVTSTDWVNHGAPDLERFRPLTNVDDGVNKLLWVYDNPDKVAKITNRAYRWIKKLSWKAVARDWDKLFKQTFKELEIERKNPQKTKEVWQKAGPVPTRPATNPKDNNRQQ